MNSQFLTEGIITELERKTWQEKEFTEITYDHEVYKGNQKKMDSRKLSAWGALADVAMDMYKVGDHVYFTGSLDTNANGYDRLILKQIHRKQKTKQQEEQPPPEENPNADDVPF